MRGFRISLIAAAAGLAALASSPAWADLEITINGVSGTNLCATCYSSSDTFAGFSGSVGNFNVNSIGISGYQLFGGNGLLMDDADLNINTVGSGSLTILLSQNNLTGSQILDFFGTFSSTQLTNMTVTRTFYLDANNTLNAETTFLGQTTTGGVTHFTSLEDLSLNAHYSLTEEIDLTANGAGATLSADDDIRIPEPVSLSLFGSGLLALGFMSRRRRKAAKKA